jgi:hypothetical protein
MYMSQHLLGRVFRSISIVVASVCVASIFSAAHASVYKCEQNGKISYSETPCPEESTGRVMGVVKTIDYSDTGTARGWVNVNDKRMSVEGSVAVWYEDKRELWIYLFPFPIDEDIREPMLATRGNGHQFRAVDELNPDAALWEQTPFVVFQFLFDESRRTLETLRHSRFVSWHRRIPTTINYRADETIKTQHYQQFYVTATNMAVLSSRSSDTFAERLYTWDVQIQAPLMTFARR